MKYVAKPVPVEAFRIETVVPLNGEGLFLGNSFALDLEDGNVVTATEEMTARMVPAVGDYWVVQPDGYTSLNPKEVFERKYEASL